MLLWKLHFSNALSCFRKIIFLPIITQRKVWIREILVLFVCFSFWLHLPHPSPKHSSFILLWFPVHYLEKNTHSFPIVYWLLVSSYIFLIPCHWFHWTSLSRPGSCVRHCEIEGMDLGLLGPLWKGFLLSLCCETSTVVSPFVCLTENVKICLF